MNTLVILLAQTKWGATLEIASMLMGAAIIGYGTAWLYTRSIYQAKIKVVELERHELNNHIINLNGEKSIAEEALIEKEKEFNHLNLEVKALKALHSEADDETNVMALKNKRNEQLLYEKDQALTNIAIRKHLLDYNSFGKATLTEKDNLKMISGIGPFIEERLHALDIFTFLQISKFTRKDISTINAAIEYFSGRIERDEWVAQAKELVISEEHKKEFLERIKAQKFRIFYDRIGVAKQNEADDLTTISGIGGWIKEKLNALDIFTFSQISKFTDVDVEMVTDAIEYFPGRIERDEWIMQAKELVKIEGNKVEQLKRIQELKVKISYDQLGIAHKHQANNLTLIKGISLWIEEKLNTLEIYTYEQISRLKSADIVIITDILEISANRIENEKWVSQAREFAKRQVNQEVSL
jgi:predicted flap endonuclease-1-like 5' DNA nuclease